MKRFVNEKLVIGEAGSIDGSGVEKRPVFQWEMRLYDPVSEREYQLEARNRTFHGKGPERVIPRTDLVVKFDLPKGLWNYPGGVQSMFRYDKKSRDESYIVRIAVYFLDERIGSEERIQACHQQIEEMLESIQFISQR